MNKKILSVFLLFAGLLWRESFCDEGIISFEESMDEYLAKEENIEKIGKALEDYYQKRRRQLREKQEEQARARLEKQFNDPVKIEAGNSPILGNPDAKITIVEFSDFQCPYCDQAAKTMEDVLKAYPDGVRVVFKNFPLSSHPEAQPAAKAALAAREQGKFKEMHDALFKNQNKLGTVTYIEIAEKLGLDMEKFMADLEDEKLDEMVKQDMTLAKELGIRGTPAFFVNGVEVSGARPLPYFKSLIDRWLEKTP